MLERVGWGQGVAREPAARRPVELFATPTGPFVTFLSCSRVCFLREAAAGREHEG